jgi:formate dehydrogenase alpha subunit
MTNSIAEIEKANVILAAGTNTTEAHPVIATRIHKAMKRNGTKLIVIDPRKTDLAAKADIWLRPYPGTNVAIFNGLLNVIIAEGLVDEEFVAERTENFAAVKEAVAEYTPAKVEEISGVPAALLVEAARLYGQAERGSILYTMGVTQHSTGTEGVFAVANLAMATGNMGKEGTGVNPLRGQNNVQGACDLGALPNVITGYQPVTNAEIREKFAQAWGVEELSAEVGLKIGEIIDGAGKGTVKALYVMGENPMLSDPDVNHVEECLKNLDFLVVQDIFLTETAQLADVVLPAASFAEKDGTFTSTERRVSRVRKAVSPRGNCKADWEIIAALAARMGYEMNYSGPEGIMQEIAAVTPSYGGITYERLEKGGLQWPCPNEDHPGTAFLHAGKFARGKGLFNPVTYKEAAEVPDEEYPFYLTTGRILYHYHTGTMTRRVDGLNQLAPCGLLEVNPEDAQKLGIEDGEVVRISSRRGSITPQIVVTERVAPGVVFINFHYRENAANVLTNAVYDPLSGIPEFKVCAVKIEKI